MDCRVSDPRPKWKFHDGTFEKRQQAVVQESWYWFGLSDDNHILMERLRYIKKENIDED